MAFERFRAERRRARDRRRDRAERALRFGEGIGTSVTTDRRRIAFRRRGTFASRTSARLNVFVSRLQALRTPRLFPAAGDSPFGVDGRERKAAASVRLSRRAHGERRPRRFVARLSFGFVEELPRHRRPRATVVCRTPEYWLLLDRRQRGLGGDADRPRGRRERGGRTKKLFERMRGCFFGAARSAFVALGIGRAPVVPWDAPEHDLAVAGRRGAAGPRDARRGRVPLRVRVRARARRRARVRARSRLGRDVHRTAAGVRQLDGVVLAPERARLRRERGRVVPRGHRRGKDEARRGPKRRGERAARRRGRRARLPVARNERRCEHRDGRDERRVDDAGARSISD